MSWFSKKTQQANNTNLKTSTPTTSDQTESKSVQSHSRPTTKMQTVVAGGKTKRHRRKKALSEADFNAIHTLFDSGLPQTQIAVAMGVSAGHIGTLLSYNRWEDYCEFKKRVNEERKLQKKQQLEQARKELERKKIEVKTEEELEQWQFIVGWSSEEDRLKANAVRDLAKALGLRVEE